MEQDIIVKPSELQNVGDNLQAVQKGNKLIMVVDLTQDIGPSSSGKMMNFA